MRVVKTVTVSRRIETLEAIIKEADNREQMRRIAGFAAAGARVNLKWW
ncbi:MAG TPA: hypothetical protein VN328_02755 [Thermodesulfovibrionales bacterium]|nr:hypothetical protein [Thermodesulfovibrionales bacterium]